MPYSSVEISFFPASPWWRFRAIFANDILHTGPKRDQNPDGSRKFALQYIDRNSNCLAAYTDASADAANRVGIGILLDGHCPTAVHETARVNDGLTVLQKDDLETTVASSITLNLVVCAVLQEKPITEAKNRVMRIIELYRQHLLDALGRHGIKLDASHDALLGEVFHLMLGDEADKSSEEDVEPLNSTIVSAVVHASAGTPSVNS